MRKRKKPTTIEPRNGYARLREVIAVGFIAVVSSIGAHAYLDDKHEDKVDGQVKAVDGKQDERYGLVLKQLDEIKRDVKRLLLAGAGEEE